MKKTNILKNFIKNREYIFYYARIILKTRVAGSYLGFLWLYIDPLMFMLIYSFVVQIIFRSNVENFNVFVLIGLTAWNLFSRTVLMSTTAIVRNKAIFQQVYFHKFVYPTIYLISYIYEFLISMSLVVAMMFISGIPFTWHFFEFIPVLLVLALFSYGLSLIISHFGVYLFDLRNILEFTLRFFFYMTPIMWSFENLQFEFKNIMALNPMHLIIQAFRDCLLYAKSPNYLHLLIITILSLGLIQIGYALISKKEDAYARMI